MRTVSLAIGGVLAIFATLTTIGTAQAGPLESEKCLTVAAYPQPPKPGMVKRFSLPCGETMVWIMPSTNYAECAANAALLGTSVQFCIKPSMDKQWEQAKSAQRTTPTDTAAPLPATGAQASSARPTAKVR